MVGSGGLFPARQAMFRKKGCMTVWESLKGPRVEKRPRLLIKFLLFRVVLIDWIMGPINFFGMMENLPGNRMWEMAKTLVNIILWLMKGEARDLILLQAAWIFGSRWFQVLRSSSSLDMGCPRYKEERDWGVDCQKGGRSMIGDWEVILHLLWFSAAPTLCEKASIVIWTGVSASS